MRVQVHAACGVEQMGVLLGVDSLMMPGYTCGVMAGTGKVGLDCWVGVVGWWLVGYSGWVWQCASWQWLHAGERVYHLVTNIVVLGGWLGVTGGIVGRLADALRMGARSEPSWTGVLPQPRRAGRHHVSADGELVPPVAPPTPSPASPPS